MELFKLLGKIVIENSEANEEIDVSTKKASDASGKISGAFKKVGAAVATYFAVDKIKDFGLGCLTAAADANAAASQFTQVFGDLEGKAGKSLSGIANEAGISENRLKGSFTQIAAFAKTTGMDTENALGLSERAMIAVADSAAFYDRSIEDTTESLQSFLKGNYENDAALGLSATETTRNAAANKLYGKSFNELSESQKQLTLLQMVEDANKASGAIGQAARESDTWTNVNGNLKQSWTDFQAVIGSYVLPTAVNWVKSLAEKVSGLTEKVPAVVEKVGNFVDKAKELGDYAGQKLKPIMDDIKMVFGAVKDAVQPLIDKFSEYVSSGGLANDTTALIKGAVDGLATAYKEVRGFIEDVVKGFKDAVEWGKEHETAVTLIAVAIGTLTAAIGAYNIAMAIKNAGGIAEIAQLGILQVQLWALSAAQAAQTVATTVATAATSAFGAVMAFVTSPITLVVVAIGALIAIGVLLYKNWDTISEKCSQMWSNVKEKFSNLKEAVVGKVTELKDKAVEKFNSLKTSASNKMNELKSGAIEKFNSLKTGAIEKLNSLKSGVTNKFNAIKDGIADKINSAKDKVKSAIDKIKGFFNFKVSLPKIKLPHFSIKPSGWKMGDLLKGSIPKLGIEWYKKAYNNPMILNKPSIFDYNPATGKLMGGGDGSGGEVVSGANTLMNMIQNAVATQNDAVVYYLQKIIQMLADFFPMVLEALMNMNIVLDDGTLVGRLAPAMDLELGRIKERKGRGR